jgi:hypothetical protein|tara:strand:- start:302 stop:778 length:477 start_codon:yes stop_codon:yes gene_type:complete
MATTITPATLTVTITAAISLAGQDKGFSHSHTIASIIDVVNRIMEVPTSEMAVLNFTATNPGSATAIGLNEADVRFIILTNLDDTNFIQIMMQSENSNECAHKLEAGHSLMIPISEEGVVDVHDADSSALTVSFDDLVLVTALADTATCALQVFVAGV